MHRYWDCPRCHARCRTDGRAVTRLCEKCSAPDAANPVWMCLVEEPPAKKAAPISQAETAIPEIEESKTE